LGVNLKEYLEEKLIIEYAKGEEEWVDIYITPLNRIDVTIVSDIADRLDIGEIGKFIKEIVREYSGQEGNKYSIGFLDTYNIEEADDLALRRPETKKTPITWSDVISLNKRLKRKAADRPYSVICFYSYKGGVGRTTALVQIAYNLAKQGRNLVLIDFDIEAPSFHLLFKEWIDNSDTGIEHGLVDYLYERMVNVDPRDYKIKISDIFVPIKFNEAPEGNIYVIPATTKLTYQYIFKLAQLQSKIIYENDYMEDLIKSLEENLKFDTVFIDTRTGINQWGAFSLLGFADQIMLIVSPNEENIEGLSNIIDLMKKAGLDNYVVAMSKFEGDSAGIKLAKHYFKKLTGAEQEFIGIGYIPSIAMTGKYPFVDMPEPYRALSDYILECQIVKFIIEFIKQIDVAEILSQISQSMDIDKGIGICAGAGIGYCAEEAGIGHSTDADTNICINTCKNTCKNTCIGVETDTCKGDTLKAELNEDNIKNLIIQHIISHINPALFKWYAYAMLENGSISRNLEGMEFIDAGRVDNNKEIDSNNFMCEKDSYSKRIESLIKSEIFGQRVLDLFWGIRVNPKRYSKTMISWFYEELVKHGDTNSSMVIDIINKAIYHEMDKIHQHIDSNDDTNNDNINDSNNGSNSDNNNDSNNNSNNGSNNDSSNYNNNYSKCRDRLLSIESIRKAFDN